VLKVLLILSSGLFVVFRKVKDVYLKLHQMVFLTASVKAGSASGIQFEVITVGRKDVCC
jgi:hypothetical protein